MNETVSQVMTKHPLSVAANTPYKQLDELLSREHISAVPVLNGSGEPIGVVSEADLLARLRHNAGETRPGVFAGATYRADWDKSRALLASDLMTSPVQTIRGNASLALAAVRLAESGVRRLFVVDGSRLVGVVSRRDLLKTFRRSDALIKSAIEREVFDRELSVLDGQADLTVENGIVTLVGRLESRGEVERAERFTAAISGVVEVRNRMDFVWDDRTDRHLRPAALGL
jgi:CBS domain-containing protein